MAATSRSEITPDRVCEALRKVLESAAFAQARSLVSLLRFCVEQTLQGNRPSQETIATEMGYRSFDASADSKVRREIGRLRSKLREYYEDEGAQDSLCISIPKASDRRGYFAEFNCRQNSVDAESHDPRYLHLLSEARHLWAHRTPEKLREAISKYEEAIGEDPDHAASANAGLAECYFFMAVWGFPMHETMPKAREYANEAVRINRNCSIGHAILGFVTSVYDWQWAAGEKLFRKALALSPDSTDILCCYSNHLVCVGNFSDAVRHAQLARTLEYAPSPVLLSHVGKILYVCGQLDEADRLLQFSLELNPHFYFTHWLQGLVLVARGEVRTGLQHLEQAASLVPENPAVMAAIGYTQALMENRAEALSSLHDLRRMSQRQHVPATDFAMVHAGLRDADAFFDALGTAFQEKCLYLTWLHVWPPYGHLRGDPRFASMLESLGLGADLVQSHRPIQR